MRIIHQSSEVILEEQDIEPLKRVLGVAIDSNWLPDELYELYDIL